MTNEKKSRFTTLPAADAWKETYENADPVRKFWCESLTIAPEVAEKMLLEYQLSEQRVLRPWHVDGLADIMRRGDFDQTTQIKVGHFAGRGYLEDGQHRLSAVAKSGLPQHFFVAHHEAESMDEIRATYVRTDVNVARTAYDAVRASTLVGDTGIQEYYLKSAVAAVRFIALGFVAERGGSGRSYAFRDRTLVNQLILDWSPQLAELIGCAEGATKEMKTVFRSSPILSVALVTMRYQAEKAKAFWTRVARESNLAVGTPEHTLLKMLYTRGVRNEQGQYARRVASCWNAFYEGKDLAHTQIRNPSRPIEILGTPYNGTKVISIFDDTAAKKEASDVA